jgi:predicted O-methyltransferase YrrM
MPWQIYEELSRLHDRGDFKGALEGIGRTREETASIWDTIACLEASCLEREGRGDEARDILKAAIDRGTTNYWAFFQLGAAERNAGRMMEASAAYRSAHKLIGWSESYEKQYFFTHDFFSPTWTRWFADEITAAPIEAMEVGSWQGGSSTWLLDRVISQRGGSLTCIDTFAGSSEHQSYINSLGRNISDIFDHNIKSTGHAFLCKKIVGDSRKVLRAMRKEKFDFIYIDGAHEAKYMIQDTLLSWPLLSKGGFLLFDDYDWRSPDDPRQNTAKGIDAFLELFADDIRIVSKERQVLVQKIVDEE